MHPSKSCTTLALVAVCLVVGAFRTNAQQPPEDLSEIDAATTISIGRLSPPTSTTPSSITTRLKEASSRQHQQQQHTTWRQPTTTTTSITMPTATASLASSALPASPSSSAAATTTRVPTTPSDPTTISSAATTTTQQRGAYQYVKPLSASKCHYNNQTYSIGQKWKDDCLQICECVSSDESNLMAVSACRPRCPIYKDPPGDNCNLQRSKLDECCLDWVCASDAKYVPTTTMTTLMNSEGDQLNVSTTEIKMIRSNAADDAVSSSTNVLLDSTTTTTSPETTTTTSTTAPAVSVTTTTTTPAPPTTTMAATTTTTSTPVVSTTTTTTTPAPPTTTVAVTTTTSTAAPTTVVFATQPPVTTTRAPKLPQQQQRRTSAPPQPSVPMAVTTIMPTSPQTRRPATVVATSQQPSPSPATINASASRSPKQVSGNVLVTQPPLQPQLPRRAHSLVITTPTTAMPTEEPVDGPVDGPMSATSDPASTSTTQAPSSDDAIDPRDNDLCIHEDDESGLAAFVIDQSWSLVPCNQTCRCVFRSEPRDPMYDIKITPTLNMKPRSEQTEIRCSLPAQCTAATKVLASPNCLSPRLEMPPNVIAPQLAQDKCICPNVVCRSPQPIPTTTATPKSTTTTTPTSTTTTSTTPASTSTNSPASTTTTEPTSTTTTTPTSTTTTTPTSTTSTTTTSDPLSSATPASTTTTVTPCLKLNNGINSNISNSNSNIIGNDIADEFAREPSPMMARLHEPLQQYVWHLLVALAIMTILFTIVSCLYLRKSSRIIAPISTQTSAYDNPTFTKLVSYYANQPHVLLVDEANQNFNNDAILAKQKNLEVDKSSPLIHNNHHHPNNHPLHHHQMNDIHHHNGRQHLI